MNRRRFLLTSPVGAVAAALTANAQQAGRVYRIGWLAAGSPATFPHLVDAVRQGLRQRGYVEGQNLVIDIRAAEGHFDRLPFLAAELVSNKADIILAAVSQTTQAAKQATTTIPIIMVGVANPVEAGFVASFAHPGGNITGLAGGYGDRFAAKWIELVKEVTPKASAIGVTYNSTSTGVISMVKEIERAAVSLRVRTHRMGMPRIDVIDSEFASAMKQRIEALIVVPDPFTFSNRKRLLDLAARHRLPAIYGWREAVADGGLMCYGTDQPALFRRAADYIDRILKGARAGDLPVEQPTKFELVINLKTAKALGLTIPPSLLLRADQVIE
jgi:putative ABC transport system substrate-binding protein